MTVWGCKYYHCAKRNLDVWCDWKSQQETKLNYYWHKISQNKWTFIDYNTSYTNIHSQSVHTTSSFTNSHLYHTSPCLYNYFVSIYFDIFLSTTSRERFYLLFDKKLFSTINNTGILCKLSYFIENYKGIPMNYNTFQQFWGI